MNDQPALEGKTVIVTGAGGGIGREIALLAGAHGASVLVNDFGVPTDGTGAGSAGPAEKVAAEIRERGGRALANYEDVSDPAVSPRIMAAALDAFGRVDCLVNNAGILRDRIFHKLDLPDFDAVLKVNLYGSYLLSRVVAEQFRKQETGSFVHFTSASGLVGNLGQANYAAAKLGIVGLSKSIALDMARYNVRSNCVCPFAWSRMIGTLPDRTPEERARLERFKSMSPAHIAPLVVFLAGDASREVSGQIFAVRRNEVFLMSQPRPLRSIHRAEGWTPAALAEQMLPAFRSSFYPLDRSADVFNWDPI